MKQTGKEHCAASNQEQVPCGAISGRWEGTQRIQVAPGCCITCGRSALLTPHFYSAQPLSKGPPDMFGLQLLLPTYSQPLS
ncbi:hypothetical protein GDO78_021543 [Eleutherodactylus coqui]|uniref:Uncharacterized protein n=1 Tax=Eleutherodactylus coqui TaxID=57060 RepID=A0A8J6E9V6_ELECQ|nr:hypothetical protein GDO78_021543 [Eleutherodactylus coqui]